MMKVLKMFFMASEWMFVFLSGQQRNMFFVDNRWKNGSFSPIYPLLSICRCNRFPLFRAYPKAARQIDGRQHAGDESDILSDSCAGKRHLNNRTKDAVKIFVVACYGDHGGIVGGE